MKKLLKCVVACSMVATVASFISCSRANSVSKYTEEDLVWQENFDGDSLNLNDWNFEFHEPGWVNAELQSYDDSSKNTYVKDGKLIIQALKDKDENGKYVYTSGRINTQDKHTFTYGRFEARLKVPTGKGFLPAFWMMPNEESYYGQWPKCGEIDIMEVMGHETNKLYGTLHYGEPHAQQQGTVYVKPEDNFADNYHVFAVEWEPGEMRWYCDGEMYKKVNDWFTKRDGFGEVAYPAPFDQPFYLILNVAVGGSWVGYPDDKVNFDPNSDDAKMYVDYVKVYQKKSYNENVEKPKKEKAVLKADKTGNMVVEKNENWKFLTAGGGKGAVESDGKTHTITSTEAGTLEYSVQYVQPNIPFNKGYKYRYSFDAYADEDRTMITGITAPDFNYVRRFGDEKIKLTKDKKTYSWDFVMTADDDPHGRIEYNLGCQDSVATVYISNVRLEKIGEASAEDGRLCLPDGNYIYNGAFQEGKGRLENWTIVNEAKAEVSVPNNRFRSLKVTSPAGTKAEGVIAKQTGLKFDNGVEYVVKFDAYTTDDNATVTVKIGDFTKEFAVAKTEIGATSVNSTPCEVIYTATSDEPKEFEFLLGSDGKTVYVDNVSMKEKCVVLNGEFNKDMIGWEVYKHESTKCDKEIIEVDGNKQVQLTIGKTGDADWMIQLKQNGCYLEQGKSYRIALKAKSTLDRTIMLAMQRDGSKDNNWIPYSDNLKFDLTSEFKDYEWTFTMEEPSDMKTIFTISMGAVNGPVINTEHTIVIDSIVVEEVK